ncbi:MAG TPA: nucleotidyltransferase family protein [Acidobacteriota bacterium]|nr:nucleotidyltransferase family protein [Acidobacteriota bacterium]
MLDHKIASLILAAGESARMGSPKALCRYQGETFIERIIRLHREHNLRTIVILGFDQSAILKAISARDAEIVLNPRPELGPLSSLQVTLPLVSSCEAILLHPVDHPCVRSETIGRLVEAFRRLPASILIPETSGQKGHPVLFPSRYFLDLKCAPLDQGARAVTRRYRPNIHRVPVGDPGILINVNTPEDLSGLRDDRPGIWLSRRQ